MRKGVVCTARKGKRAMIDNLALGLSHGLMLLAGLLLLWRPELDQEHGASAQPHTRRLLSRRRKREKPVA